jgi:hypothetical protein
VHLVGCTMGIRSYNLQIIAQYHLVMRRCRFCVTNVVEIYTAEAVDFVYDNYVYGQV